MDDNEGLKLQIIDIKKKDKRKVRALWILSIFAFAFGFLMMIYGLTQAIEADRQRDLAVKREQEAIVAGEETKRQSDLVASTVKALKECEELKNSKK